MRAENLQIVDLDKFGHGSKLPRTLKSIRDFTYIGKVTQKRAILEMERRYCGNFGESINGTSTIMTHREKIDVILNPCTYNLLHLKDNKEMRDNMLHLLIEEYIRYGRVAETFQRQKRKDKCEINIFNKNSYYKKGGCLGK